MKVFLICLGGCFLVILILSLIIKVMSATIRELDAKTKEWHEYAVTLENRIASMCREMKAREQIRNEEDKKINALHSGDSVANAINGLSKH